MTIPARAALGGGSTDLGRAIASRRQATQQRAYFMARWQQDLIDAEVRETRRALVREMRRRGGTDAVTFCDPDFLAVADRPALYGAILDAAVAAGRASRVDLQLFDPRDAALHLVAHRGFTQEFLTFFATVNAGARTACATAAAIREPILVDDITRSTIFAGQPTLAPLLDAGSRAVYSHPLITDGDLLGVLSFHYPNPAPRHGRAELVAWHAAQALPPVVGRPLKDNVAPR